MQILKACHPLLLAIYPAILIYSRYPTIVELRSLALGMAVPAMFVGMAWILLTWALHDLRKAALFLSVFVVLFIAYGHVFGAISVALMGTTLGTRPSIYLPDFLNAFLSVSFVLILVRVWRRVAASHRNLRPVTHWATAASAIVVGLAIVSGWASKAPVPSSPNHTIGDRPFPYGRIAGAEHPDVYYVVLDGYAREDVLRQHYGFDNRDFQDWLEEQGFLVVKGSRANYAWTHLALSSTLNMRYVSYLTEWMGEDSRNQAPTYELIRNNEVLNFLSSRGYQYVHLGSTWGPTMWNDRADQEIRCEGSPFRDEFFRAMVETTWLRLIETLAGQDLATCHLQQFEALAKSVGIASPKFVFAHFIPPHHPYLFARDGTILKRARLVNQFDLQAGLWADKDAYLEQLIFVSRRLTDVIGRILAHANDPPVIVLHSDHGPQLVDASEEDFRHARFANFLAVLLPPGLPPLPEGTSSANLFSHILNRTHGAGFQTLPDSFFFSDFNRPYRFTAVEFGENGDLIP